MLNADGIRELLRFVPTQLESDLLQQYAVPYPTGIAGPYPIGIAVPYPTGIAERS